MMLKNSEFVFKFHNKKFLLEFFIKFNYVIGRCPKWYLKNIGPKTDPWGTPFVTISSMIAHNIVWNLN